MHKQIWVAEDYSAAVDKLADLKVNNDSLFVEYMLTEGQLLFNRITAYNKYDSIGTGIIANERAPLFITLTNSLNQLMRVCYIQEKKNGKLVLGSEVIACLLSSLTVNRINFELIHSIFPNINSLDTIRKEGYIKMQKGLFAMLTGALITISRDFASYHERDIIKLAVFLKPFIAHIKHNLAAENLSRLDSFIDEIKESGTYPAAREIFSK